MTPDQEFKTYKRSLDLDVKVTVLMMLVGLNIFFTLILLFMIPATH
jgi:hypothetical protein